MIAPKRPNPAQPIKTVSPWKIGSGRVAGEVSDDDGAPSVPVVFEEAFAVPVAADGPSVPSDIGVAEVLTVAGTAGPTP